MASPSRLPSARRPGASGRSRPVSMFEGPMLSLEPPRENGTTAKSMKRRSLLPTFARKVSGEEKDDTGDAPASIPEEPRPRKAMDETDRRAMPPPPSKLSRPTSLYGASGLGRTPSVRPSTRDAAAKNNEARVEALAKLTGSTSSAAPRPRTTTEPGHKSTSSTRLPQGPGASRGLMRATSVRSKEPHGRSGSTAGSTSSYTTTPSIAEKRASITRARPPSVDSSARPRQASVTSPASPASSTTSRQSTTRAHMPPPGRPAFNTFQQHYSPAKSAVTKPPIPSTRAVKEPAAVEEDMTITSEVAKQQVELLQLSLLHQASTRTLQEYDASARKKLGRKQAKLRKEYEAIRAIETEQQRVANLMALDAWCHDPALLAEHLQILGKVYGELSALTEQGSRYELLTTEFETWTEGAQAASRASFIEPLSPEWHKSHTSLALRLRALQRDIEMLPPPPRNADRPSGLELVVDRCRDLHSGMLKELEIMTKLERGLLEQEKRRVDEEVSALELDGDASATAAQTQWVPAWQRLL